MAVFVPVGTFRLGEARLGVKVKTSVRCALVLGLFASACAQGAPVDDGSGDGGSPAKDSSAPPKDSGGKDSPSGQDSSPGIDSGPNCNSPMTLCNGSCVDTKTDTQHCGDCTTACTSGQTCSESMCCASNETVCNGACTDTSSDLANCGACGKTCSGACNSGNCVLSSKPPQGNCVDSLCTDNFDPQVPGCDPTGCVNKVCAADFLCCFFAWDSTCVAEVATYCSPYTCN